MLLGLRKTELVRDAWVLQGGPMLDLDFVRRRYFWDRRQHDISELTYSGGANSTYIGDDKLLRAHGGTPRLVYDIVTGAANGYQSEAARTNLCLWSDDFTNAVWTATNMTTAKTATGPDGVANSATTLTATAGNATVLQAITDASNPRISSVYIKRRTGSGTINITQNNGTTWTAVTVTSAWTRVQLPNATVANPIVGVRIVTSGDAVDVFGFQNEIEPNAGFGATVSSLARTTSATVTKTADSLSLPVSSFGFPLTCTGISGFTEYAKLNEYSPAIDIQNSVTNQERFFLGDGGGLQNFVIYDGSSLHVNMSVGSDSVGVFQKVAAAMELNSANMATSGVLSGADDISCTVPSPTTLYIGALKTGVAHGSLVRRIALWNYRLPNATLINLTS